VLNASVVPMGKNAQAIAVVAVVVAIIKKQTPENKL
jgi:hypothetical protein